MSATMTAAVGALRRPNTGLTRGPDVVRIDGVHHTTSIAVTTITGTLSANTLTAITGTLSANTLTAKTRINRAQSAKGNLSRTDDATLEIQ